MTKKLYAYNKEAWDINKYHHLKIFVNNKRKNIAVDCKAKILEINSDFWHELNESQKFFMLEWARKFSKCKNINQADEKALAISLLKGFNKEEILSLYKTCSFFSTKQRQQRILNLLTISVLAFKIKTAKDFVKSLFKKGTIKHLIINNFRKLKAKLWKINKKKLG